MTNNLFVRLETLGLVKIGISDNIIGLRFVSTHSLYVDKSKFAHSGNYIGGYYSPKLKSNDTFNLASSYGLGLHVTDDHFMFILHSLQDTTISALFGRGVNRRPYG